MAGTGNKIIKWVSKAGDFIWPRMLAAKKADLQSSFSTSEKVMVFVIAYVIAIGGWLTVNLDRDFNLNLTLELATGIIADDLALAAPIPRSVDVSIFGEGWKLLNIYNSPPTIPINLENHQVDISDQVRAVISGYQNLIVTRVQPSVINVSIEPKVTKKVPIVLHAEILYGRQFNLIGSPRLRPDSVYVTGAQSIVSEIDAWPTVYLRRENVRESIRQELELESPPEILSLNTQTVDLDIRVTEFTEGELRLPLRIRGLPRGREVVFNPSVITIRYDVPIDEYQSSQDIPPFAAFIDYTSLLNDQTGLISPSVESIISAPNIRLKSVQPRTISYYIVVEN